MFYRVQRDGVGRSSSGLSLLEVVIAVAILTSLTLSATLIFVPVSRQARVNREVAIANSEAKRVMEQVQSVPFKDITKIYPNGRQIIITGLPNGKITTTYEDPTVDPLVMRAVISWDSPDLGSMLRTFYTVRTE